MAAQVIPFDFESNEVRTLLIDDQPWFVAADVAAALNYRMASDMTGNLDDDEKGTQNVRTPYGDQEMNVINESGLYSAILRSRKPEAKRFKKWVTSEVLPAIRKHGRYDDGKGSMSTLLGPTIGTDGFRCLAAVLDGKVKHLPVPVRKRAKQHVWSQVHKAFSVVSAQDIPACEMEAVRNFVASYALEGEWIGKDSTQDSEIKKRIDAWSKVARHRWKELDRLTERQNNLIHEQERLLEEQRKISNQISDIRSHLYDPLFESAFQLRKFIGENKADESNVLSIIDAQNRRNCR